MDERMIEITDWYNEKLHKHRLNKREFNIRNTGPEGKIDLDSANKAVKYGELCKETEILNQIGSILLNDPSVFDIPDDLSDIDKT